MIGIPCEDCGEVTLVERDQPADVVGPAWCDRCLSTHDIPTLPMRVQSDDAADRAVTDPVGGKLLEFRLPAPMPSMGQLRSELAVEALEGMLERARRGEVVSVAIAAELQDGAIATVWTPADDVPRLGFSIQMLAHRYVASRCESSEPYPAVPGDLP